MMAAEEQSRFSPSAFWAAVGALVAFVVASVGWSFTLGSRLSAVETQASSTQERLVRTERDAEVIRGYLQSIDQRTARIEGKMDRR